MTSRLRLSISCLTLLLLLALLGCAATYRASNEVPPPPRDPGRVVYVLGDFGNPSPGLMDVTRAVARELEQDETAGRAQGQPLILELGDNLYVSGLPRPEVKAPEVRERIQAIATALSVCRYRQIPVPVVLLPGNHDYDGDALSADREWGDITRWYFLAKLGLTGVEGWRMCPGQLKPQDITSSGLYSRIYASVSALVDFMAPCRVEGTGAEVAVVAIDSQLLLDLYAQDESELADRSLERLRERLRGIPVGTWRVVATHHPVASYGEHRPVVWGRLCFGPGWPQFPDLWQGVLVIPPLGTLVTLGRWAASHRQDFHSAVQRRYRDKLCEILRDQNVSVVLSGHDHNLQLLDLSPSAPGGGALLQVISGSASHIDAVTRGPETLAYHAGHGFVRLVATKPQLTIELYDREGGLVARHVLRARALTRPEDSPRRHYPRAAVRAAL